MSPAPQPAWQRILSQAWLRRNSALAWLLLPLSWLYGLLFRLRQLLYRFRLRARTRAHVPVIVVGNVIAGGAGKTPTVMAVVQHLQARGWQPGVISRGHGRRTDDCREVSADTPPALVGDEPALIQRRTGVPVFVARQRGQAARALLAQHPEVNLLVSDDGLQHLALARDIEICVFDDRGLGNGWLLPAGPLREPWPRPVDLVLHTGQHPAFAGHRAHRALATQARRADGSQIDLATVAASGRPVLALAGIARPEAFFAMLRAHGITLTATWALPDHHDFSHWTPPTEPHHILLCTEKDALKLWPRCPEALAVPLDFTPEPAFFDALDRLLPQAVPVSL